MPSSQQAHVHVERVSQSEHDVQADPKRTATRLEARDRANAQSSGAIELVRPKALGEPQQTHAHGDVAADVSGGLGSAITDAHFAHRRHCQMPAPAAHLSSPVGCANSPGPAISVARTVTVCRSCGQRLAVTLCAFPLTRERRETTCGRAVCAACAVPNGRGAHLCRAHGLVMRRVR